MDDGHPLVDALGRLATHPSTVTGVTPGATGMRLTLLLALSLATALQRPASAGEPDVPPPAAGAAGATKEDGSKMTAGAAAHIAANKLMGAYFPITTFRLPDCPYETDTFFFIPQKPPKRTSTSRPSPRGWWICFP